VVEVLPARAFEAEHLPGAVNIPLSQLGRQTAAQLPRDRPVIVYCADSR
jgi:rhodanese-related sulfurtransferase